MRLLFLFLVVLFLFSVKRSEGTRIMPEEETVVLEMTAPERPITSDLSRETECGDWDDARMWIIRVLNPVKQLDLPTDNSKAGLYLSCRVLRSDSKFVLSNQRQKIIGAQFMSLLSVRYFQGFYIYSLKKLII